MIRAYVRIILVCGVVGVLLGGGWLANHGSGAQRRYLQEFYAAPPSIVFHSDPNCPWLHCEGEPARIPGLGAAETYGQPCEHCLSELAERQARLARQP